MNELTISLTELKSKLEKLVSLHQELKTDNDRLILENNSLKEIIEKQKGELTSFETEKQSIINKNNEEQNKIITDSKLKINELVQEVDNCIALLK